MSNIFYLPRTIPLNATGQVMPGAQASFFRTGTSTPKTVYVDAALTTAHASPVVADSGGQFPAIFLDTSDGEYRLTLKTAGGVLIYTQDNVGSTVLSQATFDAFLAGTTPYKRTAREISAGITPVSYLYPEGNLFRYGAVGDGVANDSTAFQSAVTVGLVIVPDGASFKILTPATKNGRIVMRGDGYGSKILCDSTVLTVTNGTGSVISGIYLENITAPWIITRNPSNFGASVLGTLQQSNSDGYQPTINDTDVWPFLTAPQQSQQIGPVLNLSGNDMHVNHIYGRFVRIAVTGSRNIVEDFNYRGGKGTFGALEITNLGTSVGEFNIVRNGIIRYASFCGVQLINQSDCSVIGVTVDRCGESGIKTSQGPGLSCVLTLISNCTAKNSYYDGLDTASRFPLDASQDTRNVVCNNRSAGNYRNGMNVDGQHNTIEGNFIHDNGLMGIWCLGNNCNIQGNKLVGNNYRLSATDHHLVGGGTGNTIVANTITANTSSSAIYADGTNYTARNRISGGTGFYGNPGNITSVVEGNVDDTSGFMTEQSFLLVISNVAGTIRHAISADATGNASFFSSRVIGASTTFTNTPTGADASTAFATGGKISSASTNRFILNTTAQNSPRFQFSAVVLYNDTGTALNIEVASNSRNVNGATVARPELIFTGDPAGAAYNLTTISAGKSIRIRCTGRLA